MSRKNIIIIISVFVIVLAIVLGYFLFSSNPQKQSVSDQDTNTFFPFGTTTPDNRPQQDQIQQDQIITEEEQIIPKLRKISNFPVSGYIVFDNQERGSTSTETKIRFFDKGTGHIFETTNESLTATRIVNTTFPKTQDVIFLNEKDAIARYLDANGTIKSLLGSITSTSSASSTEGVFGGAYIPDNIDNLSISPNKDEFVFLVGNTISKIGLINKKIQNVLTLDISEFLVSWPNQNNILLTTKPDSSASGYTYMVSSSGGTLKKVAGPLNGLMATAGLNPSLFLISYTNNNKLSSFVIDIRNGNTQDVLVPVIPEKCVWSNKNQNFVYCAVPREENISNMPESWYKGLRTFTDDIWRIDVSTGITTFINTDASWRNQQFDIVSPQLNEEENFFYFINKKDLTLWSYDFTGSL